MSEAIQKKRQNPKVNLFNKVAVVIGGACGVGAAVSQRFADEGARVLVVGLAHDPVPEVVEAIRRRGGIAEPYIGDVAIESQADLCIETALEVFGGIDILAHLTSPPIDSVETEHYRVSDFDRMMFTNVRSVFLMVRFALPELKKSQGSIVALASVPLDGQLNIEMTPAQVATRSWIYSFIKAIAEEGKASSVRANCISAEVGPLSAADLSHDHDAVADVCSFLVSDAATEISGALYGIDGALSLSASINEDPELNHRSVNLDLSL